MMNAKLPEVLYAICTKSGGRKPQVCEHIEWRTKRDNAAYAYRRFRVACKYGTIYPNPNPRKRGKQRRRALRGGEIELLRVENKGYKKHPQYGTIIDASYKLLSACKRGR